MRLGTFWSIHREEHVFALSSGTEARLAFAFYLKKLSYIIYGMPVRNNAFLTPAHVCDASKELKSQDSFVLFWFDAFR